MAWCGVAWRGVAWRGVAWRGVAWRGVCGVVSVANLGTRKSEVDLSQSLIWNANVPFIFNLIQMRHGPTSH